VQTETQTETEAEAEHQESHRDCDSYSGPGPGQTTTIPGVACCPKTRALQASFLSFLAVRGGSNKYKYGMWILFNCEWEAWTHVSIKHDPEPFDLLVHPALRKRGIVSH
jgi:hypothetical protein